MKRRSKYIVYLIKRTECNIAILNSVHAAGFKMAYSQASTSFQVPVMIGDDEVEIPEDLLQDVKSRDTNLMIYYPFLNSRKIYSILF